MTPSDLAAYGRPVLSMSAHPITPGAAPVPATTPRRRRCYLSRTRGWIDPDDPHRPTYEVNLLAVAIGAPVWTMGTAWESIFHHLIPLPVADAFRTAMVRARLSDDQVELLRSVADRLDVDLVVRD